MDINSVVDLFQNDSRFYFGDNRDFFFKVFGIKREKGVTFEMYDTKHPQKRIGKISKSWYGSSTAISISNDLIAVYSDKNFEESMGCRIISFKEYMETQKEAGEKTLDNLEVGDILIDEDGDKRKVLGITGSVVFLSACRLFTRFGGCYSVFELKENGFRLQGEPREYTPEEVADALGITVEELKIKGE